MPGPDRLVIANADGSFNNPLIEQHIATVAQAILDAYDPGTPDPVPLTSYVTQIASLPDYPAAFTPATHSHLATGISDSTPTGRDLLRITTPGDAKAYIGLAAVTNHAQLPIAISRPTIYATALNTFPSRATSIAGTGWTKGVTFDHTEFGTLTVLPSDIANKDTVRDLAP